MGRNAAERWTDAHEADFAGRNRRSTVMDQWNNRVGRQIGDRLRFRTFAWLRSGDLAETACFRAFDRGELVILDPDNNFRWSDQYNDIF
jgi:hypothetical protein